MKNLLSILLFLVLTFSLYSQKLIYDRGYTTAGAEYTSSVTLDTAAGTSQNAVFYIGDKNYFPFDVNPLAVADSGAGTSPPLVSTNSDRFYIGTLYSWFDANVAADSVIYTIKSYSGVLSTETVISSAKWGSSATLATVRSAGDFMTITNVWVDSSAYKHYPPEVLKVEYAPVKDSDNDDSTSVFWKFVYPVYVKGSVF